MNYSDFSSEIPYSALSELMKRWGDTVDWTPTEWQQDISTGKLTPLVYWFPKYINYMYEVAETGEEPTSILSYYHWSNRYYFKKYFKEVYLKLKKVQKKARSLKENHLDEIKIVNGRVRL